MNEIRLIVFDLGRVLVRICDNWQHACEAARLPVDRTISPDPATRAEMMKLVVASETGRMQLDDFCRQMSPLLKMDVAHVHTMSDIYLLGVFPGAVELVDDLNAAGYTTACLSNTNASHWALMSDRSHAAYFPLDRLTHQFASHLVGHRKPAEEIYRHVEQATGFHGGQIVFFDDLPENTEAAGKLGWRTVTVPRVENPVPQMRQDLERLGVLRPG